MALPPSRDVQRRFWGLIRSGCMVEEAAVAIGVPSRTGWYWFRKAGGMPPLSLDVKPSKLALSLREREQIAWGLAGKRSIRAIAGDLGRPASTVWREIQRNTRWPNRGPFPYRPSLAQRRADAHLARPKQAKLAGSDRLREAVQDRLTAKLSPEQICVQLRRSFPDEPEMWVSHETIYQSLYVQGRGALRRELAGCLRTGRAIRKPRQRSGQRRGRIKDMVLISDRPAEVQDRAVPGHWEGDLIVGKNSASAIGTLVERTTRFVMLLHLPDQHGALEVQDAMVEAMSRLPKLLKKSLTWDQGLEMANHTEISLATGLEIYFCDPHSPWQRGSNENTNGLLRQYFPKGTDLSGYHRDYLDFVANQLNDRPRKTLGWKTPKEALNDLLSSPPPNTGVALTG